MDTQISEKLECLEVTLEYQRPPPTIILISVLLSEEFYSSQAYKHHFCEDQ